MFQNFPFDRNHSPLNIQNEMHMSLITKVDNYITCGIFYGGKQNLRFHTLCSFFKYHVSFRIKRVFCLLIINTQIRQNKSSIRDMFNSLKLRVSYELGQEDRHKREFFNVI